jgi:hypothetical protein
MSFANAKKIQKRVTQFAIIGQNKGLQPLVPRSMRNTFKFLWLRAVIE